jgi:cysteinyl-tRNA synthetase
MMLRVCRQWIKGLAIALLTIVIVTCGYEPEEPAYVPAPVSPTPPSGTGSASVSPGPAVPQGTVDKWALWTGTTQLRGANIYQRRVIPELDGPEFMGDSYVGPPYSQADLNRLASLGANYVNISHPGLFTENPPFALEPAIQENLDRLLSMIAQADMFAVISFRTGPGRSEFTFFWDEVGDWFDDSYLNDTVWQDQAAQDAWVSMWRHTAERYRDHPVVVGYDLMVEPNANEVGSHALHDPLDIWEPDEFYAQYGGTLYDWNQLYPRITAAIREVDPSTPLLVGGLGYSAVQWLPYLQPTGDPRTVYVVHQYAPTQYTHQWPDSIECTYPGRCDLDWDGDDEPLDRDWLANLMAIVDEFAAGHGVPVAANEFGVVRWVPGGAAFMDDLMDLFEQRGINHALWVWDPAWEPWTEEVNAFNIRHGPEPENHDDASNDLLDVITTYWRRNVVRPSSLGATTTAGTAEPHSGGEPAGPLALADVRSWAYQLQGLSEPGAVDALVASNYDMLVLEPTRTDWSSDDRTFDTRAAVSRLKGSRASDGVHRKLVVAYADIGEAEDWRWYWSWSTKRNCRLGPPADWPDYILGCDPDGWIGNYPVAYWDPAWKDVVLYGRHQTSRPYGDYVSVLDEILRDGFDGIYLDWVEGYEHDAVLAAAEAERRDSSAEMIAFIREIRQYATARQPGFLVIQQNAAALVNGHPELLGVIDAIAQEGIWYSGGATDGWDDRDGYDRQTDPDLTDYYLEHLAHYLDAGVPVFNCEYALVHADAAYANSYAQGLVPYVTRSSLSQLTTTPPPGP